MSPQHLSSITLQPADVHGLLARHSLADRLPLVLDLEESRGAWLKDAVTGKTYLDFFSSFSTCPIGFNHSRLYEQEFIDDLLPAAVNKISNSDLLTESMARFVERFVGTLPTGLRQHLFFIEGGALAVENALKAAFDWKKRLNLRRGKNAEGSQVVHFLQAFHGRSGYTLSLTNTHPAKTDFFPKFDWPRISNPKLTFPLTAERLSAVKSHEKRALTEIRQALIDNPDDIAALIIEPIQGEGGDNHFRGEFLTELRVLADENEFLLIFDEVQTGFSTTGRWWCFEHFDVQPDILVFGKKTQVCGIAANSRLDQVSSVFHQPGRINSTWGGNLVDMVRCRRIIEIIDQESLLSNAARVGAELLAGLESLSHTFPDQVTSPRGRGMFVAFDLADGETRDRTLQELQSSHLLALPCGQRAIRFRPPISLTSAEATEGLQRCESALTKVLRRPGN